MKRMLLLAVLMLALAVAMALVETAIAGMAGPPDRVPSLANRTDRQTTADKPTLTESPSPFEVALFYVGTAIAYVLALFGGGRIMTQTSEKTIGRDFALFCAGVALIVVVSVIVK